MELKPIERVDSPAYPTKQELLTVGDSLAHHVPRGWSRKAFTGALAMLLAAAGGGCGTNVGKPLGGRPLPPDLGELPPAYLIPVAYAWCESIFEDQSPNRGMLGCVAIMPPTFLPEDEAVEVLEVKPSLE